MQRVASRYHYLGFDNQVSALRSLAGTVFCRLLGHPLEPWHHAPYVYQKGERECLLICEPMERCARCGQFAIKSEPV